MFKYFICLAMILSVRANAQSSVDAIVYVISGGPVNTGGAPAGNYQKYLDRVREMMRGHNVFTKARHNSEEALICNEIIEVKQANPNARIALSGHSYGSDAAVSVARCLEARNIRVDILLTADTVARNATTLFKSLTIPENVSLNFHYYQQADRLIKGSGFNRRQDGSFRSIYNFKQNFGTGAVQPHLAVYSNLVGRNIHPVYAEAALRGSREAEIIEIARPLNEAFFRDYPLLPIGLE